MDIRKIIKEEVDDFDWAKDITPAFNKNNMPEVGDVVTTLPGFTMDFDDDLYGRENDDPNCGGYGYQENHTFTIHRISSRNTDRPVLWPTDNSGGIYVDATTYP